MSAGSVSPLCCNNRRCRGCTTHSTTLCPVCACVCGGETVLSYLRAFLTQLPRESVRRRACVSLYVPGVCQCGSAVVAAIPGCLLVRRRAEGGRRRSGRKDRADGPRTAVSLMLLVCKVWIPTMRDTHCRNDLPPLTQNTCSKKKPSNKLISKSLFW